VFSWLVLGFLAGSIAGIATGNRREGCLAKIAVGIVGALVGGSLARAAGISDVSFRELTLRSVLIATVGAALLLLVLQAVTAGGGRGRGRGWGR
jgi:uncharacterized membrane protein YeaQ/YmgE (transglycosylase-associated protein family)